MSAVDDIPTEAHPKIRRLVDYWHDIRPAQARLPSRKDVSPFDIPDLLRSICLVDVVHDPDGIRFRHRLQGSSIVAMLGRDTHGLPADIVEPAFAGSRTEASYLRCVTDRRPDWRRGLPNMSYARPFAELERVFLPLAADGERPDMLLTLTIFYDGDGRALYPR